MIDHNILIVSRCKLEKMCHVMFSYCDLHGTVQTVVMRLECHSIRVISRTRSVLFQRI